MPRRNARSDVPIIDLSDEDIIIISDDEDEATTSGSDSYSQELQRNTQSRVVPVELIPVVLPRQERSVGTVPHVVPTVHQSSRSWTTRPQASNFLVGESSRQAERRGFTNMRPSNPHNALLRAVPPHFNPAQQYHQRLAEIYQESNPHRRQPISLPPHPTPPTIGAPPSLPLHQLAGGQPPLRPNTITAAAAASLTMTELVIAASRGNLPPAPQFTVEVHVPAPPMEQHRLPEQESNPHRRQPISLPPHPTPPTIGAPPSLPLHPLAGGQPPLRPNTITAAAAASLTMTELVIAASRGNLPPAPQFTVEVHVPAPPMEQHHLPELDLQRARLIDEMQGTVDHFRRNGGLSPEETNNMANMMVEEQMQVSEEMDVDVDTMSYEELLAIEEEMGYVSTGLTEEHIVHHLRPVAYHFFRLGPPVDEEICCVCQEEYINGEELARLPCSHQFHYNCIKQWLMQKNVCPICKATVCSEGN